MALGVDVGVDAHRDAHRAAQARADRLEPRQLARRFDVDRLEPERDRRTRAPRGVLPTPVKTICDGAKPALRATSISHTELASTALPSSRSSRAIASVEFAFSA